MLVMYSVNPSVTNEQLNRLFAESWENHEAGNFEPILSRSLAYVCAYCERRLVGFINVAWDGGIHAFLLDTTVHPDVRRNGIGQELVRRAAAAARAHGIVWLHVDFEPHLTEFYRSCGFTHTEAGVLRLRA
jgi:GNAT superfamily N-acetyltransferase